MSTYPSKAINPDTGKEEPMIMIDDYFGNYNYGIKFVSWEHFSANSKESQESRVWREEEIFPPKKFGIQSVKPKFINIFKERIMTDEQRDFLEKSAEENARKSVAVNPDKMQKEKEEIYNSAGFNDKEKVKKAAEESVVLMKIEEELFKYGLRIKEQGTLHHNETLEYANKIFNLINK